MLEIAGSRCRAAILSALFGEDAHAYSLSDLSRRSGLRHSAVLRELTRLVRSGLVRRWTWDDTDPSPKYEADRSSPGYQELRRLVLVRTGRAARIRESLAAADARQLAWIHGPYAELMLPFAHGLRVVAITRVQREVRDALRRAEERIHRRIAADVMSIEEWTSRLQSRDMRLLSVRRAQRLWLLGDGEALRRAERTAIVSRSALKNAIENWREELSDEWDEDFDPSRRAPGAV